ncbi:hypothetical protein [Agrobacterium tumefaciens]|uniref:hypothetical protein n=1 Tax=Agrobacterium tumefaciens TaxID=358 RepID=UPI00165930B0|nr:hypothetical protein [Agrobacterium tumefaciens]QNP78424.1 hypothetical protein IAI05_07625 [Agrobacterium tumefaciens]
MEYGFTLHSIRRKDEELPVGQVQQFTDKDYKDMLRLDAVREPTTDEMKLYKLAHPDEEIDLDNDETGADETKSGKGKGKGKATPSKTSAAGTEPPASGEGVTPAAGEGESGALV